MGVQRDKFGRFIKGSDPINKNNITFNMSKQDWFNLYWKQNLTCDQIAMIFNTNPVSIINFLRKFNIKIRASGFQKGHPIFKKNFAHSEQSKEKISKTLLGKYGELSRNWQGGLSDQEYPWYFNDKLKLQIRIRDNFICHIVK